MDTYTLNGESRARDIISAVQRAEGPVAFVKDGEECFVAMGTAVFEQLLFDNLMLGCSDREALHL